MFRCFTNKAAYMEKEYASSILFNIITKDVLDALKNIETNKCQGQHLSQNSYRNKKTSIASIFNQFLRQGFLVAADWKTAYLVI